MGSPMETPYGDAYGMPLRSQKDNNNLSTSLRDRTINDIQTR